MVGTQIEEISFIIKQKNRFNEKFVVRLPQNENGWDIKKTLETHGKIRFDDVSTFYDSISRASLVICSTWNTTVLESLCAGVPTVVIKPIAEFEEDFLMDAEEMRKNELLFENHRELDLWLDSHNSVESVNEWWGKPKRQTYIERFKSKYVYMPNNAGEIWEKELLDLCN